MQTLALIAVLLFSMTPAQSKPADLSGKWAATFTATRPDGTTQSIQFQFDFTQKGKVLTGTVGPSPERQWPIEKGGTVDGTKANFKVQQPEGPMRTFTLTLVKDRLQGEMLAELNGQSFTAKVDAGRAPKTK